MARKQKQSENKRILIISVIIVILLGISSAIYLKNYVNNAIDQAIKSVEVIDLVPSEADDTVGSWHYRLIISVKNTSPIETTVTFQNMEILLNNLSLGEAVPLGEWRQHIRPGASASFVGDIQISGSSLEVLRNLDKITLQAKGNVSMTARYLWINEYRDQVWNINKDIKLY